MHNIKKSFFIKISATIVLTAFCFTQTVFAAPEIARQRQQNLRPLNIKAAAGGAVALEADLLTATARNIGLDGNSYEDAVPDASKEDAIKRINSLKKEIEGRVTRRPAGQKILTGDAAVNEVKDYLLERLIALSNCSDKIFRINMTPHMRDMSTLALKMHDIKIGGFTEKHPDCAIAINNFLPAMFIAASLHDINRLFDGYFLTTAEESALDRDRFNQYFKYIQHPREAAAFARTLLKALQIDDRTILLADILIRCHETGISDKMLTVPEISDRFKALKLPPEEQTALIWLSDILKQADAISFFQPDLFLNGYLDALNIYNGDTAETIALVGKETKGKYGRLTPVQRQIADASMSRLITPEVIVDETGNPYSEEARRIAYYIFSEARIAVAAAGGVKAAMTEISENNGVRTIKYTYKDAAGAMISNEFRSDRGLIHSRYLPYRSELIALADCPEVKNEIKTHAAQWRPLMTSEISYIPNELRLLVFDVKNLVERFKQMYGDGPVEVIWVPSRINIIGEHIDYVAYIQVRVLPFASNEYGMCIAFRPRHDTKVNVASTHSDFTAQEFDIKNAPREKNWLQYLAENGVPEQNWSNYIKGALYYLQNKIQSKDLCGMDTLVDSNTPAGAGASTSSILVVAGGYEGRKVNGLPIDRSELGRSSAEAEWFTGSRGGAMDQTTISMGMPGRALSMKFQPVGVTTVPIPRGYKFVTFYTTRHEGGSQLTSEYNERSSISRFVIPAALTEILKQRPELQEAWNRFKTALETNDLAVINELIGVLEEKIINSLPETLTLAEISRLYPEAYTEIVKEREGAYKALFEHKANAQLMIRNLCRHHVGEVIRVIKSETLLREAALAQQQGDQAACDAKMQELGKIISEAHESLRDLYKVSTDDLNEVAAITNGVEGVLGGRVIGGGFGGNYMALVRDDSVNRVISAVDKGYYQANNRDSHQEQAINIHTPGTGVCDVPTDESLAAAAAAGADSASANQDLFNQRLQDYDREFSTLREAALRHDEKSIRSARNELSRAWEQLWLISDKTPINEVAEINPGDIICNVITKEVFKWPENILPENLSVSGATKGTLVRIAPLSLSEETTAAATGNISESLKQIKSRYDRDLTYAVIIGSNPNVVGPLKKHLSLSFNNVAVVRRKAQVQSVLDKWGVNPKEDLVLIVNLYLQTIKCNLPDMAEKSLGKVSTATDIHRKIEAYLGDV